MSLSIAISSKVDILKTLYIIKSWQMQFEKKKSILKYLGKDGKDVRALNRMLERWEVEFDWVYYTLKGDGGDKENESKWLGDIENFLSQKESEASKVDISRLEMAEANANYYQEESERLQWELDEVSGRVYRFLKQRLHLKNIDEEMIERVVAGDADDYETEFQY